MEQTSKLCFKEGISLKYFQKKRTASRGTTLISDSQDFLVKTLIAEIFCLENVKNQLTVPMDSQAMELTDPHRFAGRGFL